MEKPLTITISGDLGSGKSVLAAALVTQWKAERYSTGLVQRQLAEKLGITTLELNKRAETDTSIDDQIDSIFKDLVKTETNLVVDSRLAFHFLPQSYRIKLEVHPAIAAQRIKDDTSRVGEGQYNSLAEIEAAIIARKASERARFKRYYGVDIDDHAGFDLVINTNCAPAKDVVALAGLCTELWHSGKKPEKTWVSPRQVYCEVNPTSLDVSLIEKYKHAWPQTGQWPLGAVTASRVGYDYVITSGFEWVAAGLSSGCVLMPVTVTGQVASLPERGSVELWQKMFDYNILL